MKKQIESVEILSLAERTDDLQQSDIRAVTHRVNDAGGINLGQGICDLPTPPPIMERAKEAIDEGKSVYSHFAGIGELRRGILHKAQNYNRLPATSEEEVMVSAGSTGAFVAAVLALLNPGDEAILLEPFYGYHRNILSLFGVGINYARMRADSDWAVDFDALEDAITPRTRVVVVNTPGNPSGKVWTRDELRRLLDLVEEHNLYVITDEIYEYMLYDGRAHVSLGALRGAYERTITLSGFSKTYNMTGWRLGYAVGPEPVIHKMGLINDLVYICAPTPLQHGVAAAFDMDESYFDDLSAAYARKRAVLCDTLDAIGIDARRPEGAYYVFANFEGLAGRRPGFEDSEMASRTLIEEAGVAAVPGHSFFQDPDDGRYFMRFCFAKEMPVLEEACERLLEAFA